eukprot:m.299550 g.299550  ORF g.299550 m.299550 type:complete len:1706 (-) comp16415_c0_seq19:74-5191(-)
MGNSHPSNPNERPRPIEKVKVKYGGQWVRELYEHVQRDARIRFVGKSHREAAPAFENAIRDVIGVKRKTLLKFKSEIVSYNQRNDTPIVTTKDACERIIWPRNLVDSYARYERVTLNYPNVFVCHSWDGNVLDLLNTLLSPNESIGGKEEIFFWDVLCLHQSAEVINNESMQLLDFYQGIVEMCGRMILIVTPAMNPLVLQREWCLVELQHAARKDLEIHAKVASDADDFLNMFLSENHEGLNQFIGMLNNFDPKNARVFFGMNPSDHMLFDGPLIVTTFINLILTWVEARIPQQEDIFRMMFLCSKAKILFDTKANKDLKGPLGEVLYQLVAMTPDTHNIEDFIKCYKKVAVTYCEQGNLQEGTSCIGQCYKVVKEVYGEVHNSVAIFCNEAAHFCKTKSMHKTALEYYMLTLTLQQTLLGESHEDIAVTCHNIGFVHEYLNIEKAFEFHNKALAIRQEILGDDHPEVKASLRICRGRQGKNNTDKWQLVYERVSAGVACRKFFMNKLMFTGEGRHGKTSTRKALKKEKFDPKQESTRGTVKQDTEFEVLKLLREDVKTTRAGWRDHVPLAQEYFHGKADIVANIIKGSEFIVEFNENHPIAQSALQPKSTLLRNRFHDELIDESSLPVLFDYDTPEEVDASKKESNAKALKSDKTRESDKREPGSKLHTASDIPKKQEQKSAGSGSSKPKKAEKKPQEDKVVLDLVQDIMQVEKERALVLRMWDFGGQKVFFMLHHMFLTRQGVYLLVFNAQSLVIGQTITVDGYSVVVDEDTLNRCIKYIRLWFNSIFLFATNAPVLLVGTHKDKLTSQELKDAHKNLVDKFISKAANITSLQKAKDNECCFFITNVSHTQDNVLVQDESIDLLRNTIETLAVNQEHVHEKGPITWLRVRDQLAALVSQGKHRISLYEVEKIAANQGLGQVKDLSIQLEVTLMLNKFHQIGICVWFDVPNLRDLVVLNPQWLINAASTLIRDPALHKMQNDPLIMNQMQHEWDMLFREAILDHQLLPHLYPDEEYSKKERYQIITLLEKFGLIVRLYHNTELVSWLVPALLKSQPGNDSNIVSTDGRPAVSCYLFFYLQRHDNKPVLSKTNLERGFLPSGLFPRIVGKAVKRAQQIGNGNGVWELSETHAHLVFGVDEFAMYLEEDLNCIRLSIAPVLPTGLFNKILGIVQTAIMEFLGGTLNVLGLIKYDENNYIDMIQLGLQAKENIVESNPNTRFKIGKPPFKTLQQMREHCWQWTFRPEVGEYDIYVSCIKKNDEFASKLTDCQHTEKLEATGAAPTLFSRSQLQPGRRLSDEIVNAIARFDKLKGLTQTAGVQNLPIRTILNNIVEHSPIDPVPELSTAQQHRTDDPLWNLVPVCSKQLLQALDDAYRRDPKPEPKPPSPAEDTAEDMISLQVKVPKDAPWCWPKDCEEEFISVQVKGQKFFNIVDVATSPSARATHVRKMIFVSGNRNDKFDMKEVVECVAFRSKDHLAEFNTWVGKQKIAYARIDGNDVSSANHKMFLNWNRADILLKAMMKWFDTYPCRLPPSLKPKPDEAPYRSMLVFHGCADDLDTIQGICEGGFKTFGVRNDGWFGKGVYFSADLEYALAYAKSALFTKKQDDLHTTAKAVVIACEMVLFNPWPVPDSIVMRGQPITSKSDAHISVVRHAKDLSKVDPYHTNTIPIPPNTWKTAANPSGEDVSTEIVVNDIHVLPRFYLVF